MPVLSRPKAVSTIRLPSRTARIAAETDVLVVGGGPAGLGAAIGAADTGARVVLAERYGFLGGNATAALVMPLMSFHTYQPATGKGTRVRLLPDDQGPGDPVVGGVLEHLLSRLVQAGAAIKPSEATGYVVPFDPVIDIAVTPNRPHALGVAGIARDPAARGLGKLITPPIEPVPGAFPCPVAVYLAPDAAGEACPLFVGRLIRGVRNAPSPQWLQDRLRAIGHLHEAEDESQAWPELHNTIRAARKAYQQTGTMPEFAALAAQIAHLRAVVLA